MDFQTVVDDLMGTRPATQSPGVEVKPQWLARRAAYLRLNAIHSGAVRCPLCRQTVGQGTRRRRLRGLLRLRRPRV
jgi:hypothetical protein